MTCTVTPLQAPWRLLAVWITHRFVFTLELLGSVWTTAENWRTAPAVIMWRLCAKRPTICHVQQPSAFLMLRKSRPKTLWGKDHHWQRTCEFMKLQCSLLPFKWPSPSPISQIKRLSTPGIQIHTLLVYGHNSSFKRVQDEPEFTIASAFTEPLVTGTDQLVRQMSWWGEEEPCHPQLQIWDTMDAGMAMGMLYFGLEKKSGLSLLLCGGWYIVHKLCNTLVH